MAASTQAGEMPCPDPSAHENERNKHSLSNAASAAALLATNPARNSNNSNNARESPLGSDGKLSSKSAATSLKYAQAQDLPSFPSRGGDFNAASTAATLAKDHKMKDLWHPEASAAGSKAALLANRRGGKVDLWEPSSTSAGHSAATLAMRNKGLSPQIDRGHTEAGRNNSLLAATKSHNAGRQRAGSTPVPTVANYPDSHNSSKNALNAATVSHRQSVKAAPDGWNSEANQAARLKNAHMDRELFTDDPQLYQQADIDEERHQAALHASAASFARSIYNVQKRGEVDPETSSLHDGETGAAVAHRRAQSTVSPDIREEAIRYIHLQDAAHKLAQERLAKVDKDMEHGRYREYYGYPNKSQRKSRLSMRSGGRRRAASEGQHDSDDSDDELQARRIRSQMSQLNTGLDSVGDRQRQDDRAKLMAEAEKRVHAQMHSMDEKVFLETGKPTQAMMDEWEAKAKEKVERDREQRERTPGKTHIGGGKYMDDAEIEAIAAARLKPTLDELNDTAEKKRARDEALRAEKDRQETEKMEEKMRNQNSKAEFKKIREQDKAAAKREKDERKAKERAEKEEAKSRKSEDKSRKSREHRRDEAVPADGQADEQQHKSMFDRIANRLKKHGDERKKGDGEKPAATEETHDEGAAVVGVAGLGAGAAAATGLEEKHEDARSIKSVDSTHDEDAQQHDDAVVVPAIVVPVTDEPTSSVSPIADKQAIRSAEPTSGEHGGTWIDYRDPDAIPPVGHDDDLNTSSATGRDDAAAAGIVALGGMAAAGGLEAERRHKSEEDTNAPAATRDDVSSLSSWSGADSPDVNDELAPRPALYPTASAEHTGDYTFAAPSTAGGLAVRPDLERHISTIPDSDSDDDADDESDELNDSEVDPGYVNKETHLQEPAVVPAVGENRDVKAVEPAQVEQPASSAVVAPVPLVESKPGPRQEVATTISTERTAEPASTMPTDTSASASSKHVHKQGNWFETPTTKEAELAATGLGVGAAAGGIAASTTAQTPGEQPGNVDSAANQYTHKTGPYITGAAAPSQPQPITADRNVPETKPSTVTPAAAPVAETAPRDDENKGTTEKEQRGLRGFFSKLKSSKSKPSQESQGSTTAIKTDPESKKEDVAAPATAASATTEPVASTHVGTDGPIGDPKHISGIGGDPRPASPSSFERYDNEARDLDEVSSSGADEEDYARGRGGKLTKRRGLAKGKDAEDAGNVERKQTDTSNEDGTEQFEEARDHFDESLAPPPAFGGQAKSESPNRATRFQEEL